MNKIWIQSLIVISLLGHGFFTSAQSLVNDKEAELYDIYQHYHSTPTDPVLWQNLLRPLQSENYKIQSGDNLWTISEIFFGDGNYWPKVWSVNSRIENPHLIRPGNEIRFRLGTSESEPSFFISEPNSEMDSIQLAANSSAMSSGVTAPPPVFASKPILKTLPPSLPEWDLTFQTSEQNGEDWSLEVVPRPSLRVRNHLDLQSFVVDEPQFSGEVIESKRADELMVAGKSIFVSVKTGSGQLGQTFLVVYDSGPLQDQVDKENSEWKGHVLRVAGQVTLKEPVEAKEPKEGLSYFRAHIDRSLDLTTRGLKLFPGKIKKIDLEQAGKVSSLPVRVVGGQLDNRGFHFGSGQVVYLNRGSSQGVSEGDIFMINELGRKQVGEPEPLVEYTQNLAGQVQVVDVRNQFSTAIVLNNSRRIQPGDGSFN